MKVKLVEIQLEPESEVEQGHATLLKYEQDKWTVNGTLFSRIAVALGEITTLLRGRKSA